MSMRSGAVNIHTKATPATTMSSAEWQSRVDLAAVYRLEVLDTVQALLEQNRLRPVFLFDAVPTRVVSADELRDVDTTFESLRNLNTPEDYERALRDADAGAQV